MNLDSPKINFDWKLAGIATAIIVLVVTLFMLMPVMTGPVNTYFKPSNQFTPNSEGTLVVEVKNVLEEDLILMQVKAEAVDPNNIQISNFIQNQSYVGKGEMRKFEFPIEIKETREGTYTIELTISLGSKQFTQRTMLEVK